MKVLKFGGSSVADAGRLQVAARIVRRRLEGSAANGAVVVSALGGVTDRLLGLASACLEGRDPAEAAREAEALRVHHLDIAGQVAADDERPAVAATVESLCDDLASALSDCAPDGAGDGRSNEALIDRIVCHGELLSTQLLAAALRAEGLPAAACDARPMVSTDRSFQGATVDLEPTLRAIASHFAALGRDAPLQVITGFLGSSPEGETTTLGRSGSDLTAALVGAALEAERIEIWTDVPGVMTADPRRVEDALPIPRLSYEEMLELSHFGARVVYPPTVTPARRKGIPLLVRNTLDPEHPGTLIDDDGLARERARGTAVTGISSIDDVHLMLLVGDNLVGTPGVAARLFDALAASGASAILISQASSEHSICFAVEPGVSEAARKAVDAEFQAEIMAGSVRPIRVERDQSIVAVVGDGMRDRPGIAGRVFGILGRRGVNVRAVAQGSSERNISMVVARADEGRAVRWIHREFFHRAASGRLAVYVLGVGGVGSALLRQLAAERESLSRQGIDLQLRGLASSRYMHLQTRRGRSLDAGAARDPEGWRSVLERSGEAADLNRLLDHLGETAAGGGRTVLVDVTASGSLAAVYHGALAAGAAVASANKLPFAGPIADFRAFRSNGAQNVFHEATVGAGLPVLHTADMLLGAGDRIDTVSGVFSGTLAYLTGKLGAGDVWSEAVREAHRLGYTEPDPRDDLGGLDVARKLLILARICGCDLDLDDIEVEPMLDRPDLADLPLDAWWERLAKADGEMRHRFADAASAGLELAYLAELDLSGEAAAARVGLRAVPADHPVAGMPASDNMFVFRSRRYRERPLVVQGPGAGTDLTAGGVFADILRAWAERGSAP